MCHATCSFECAKLTDVFQDKFQEPLPQTSRVALKDFAPSQSVYLGSFLVNFLFFSLQSAYEDLKVFPTIAILDEKQAKYLAGVNTRHDEKSITRDERAVCT